MHSNITRDQLENMMNRNVKGTQNPSKRSALGDLSNQVGNRQVMVGKQMMKKKETQTVQSSKPNVVLQQQQFQKPTSNKLSQQVLETQVNKPVITTKQTSLFQLDNVKTTKLPEEELEVSNEEMLDMSISLDEISNMSLENIDEYDDDPLSITEYVNDIYDFLHNKELKEGLKLNYFENIQKDISIKMRSILVDWLIDVVKRFQLLNDTLFMTVALIDRFLSIESVHRKKLQLLGVTAMLIASKFEEIYAPEIADLVYICDKAYSKEEIIEFEVHMLNKLAFEISHPTPLHFLRRFSKASKSESKEHCLSKYICELSLMEFELQIAPFTPSMIAASAVYITRKMTNPKLYWNSTLRHYTNYKESDIMPCVLKLNKLMNNAQKGKTSFTAIFRKYSNNFHHVAKIPCVDI